MHKTDIGYCSSLLGSCSCCPGWFCQRGGRGLLNFLPLLQFLFLHLFEDLYAQGLLGQPASGGMSVVLRRESVGDAQLLADMFKGVIVRHPEVLEQLFSAGQWP